MEYFEWVGTDKLVTSEETDLGALVKRVASDIRELSDPGVNFRITCPEDRALVRAAECDLANVVRVLLDNALKFSPEEKSIHAEVLATADYVTLTVSDRGVGFPGKWSQEIFRPFTIVDLMHHRQGTALNLAMAKAIIEAFGGSIRAESGGIGKGARFVVQLPSAVEARSSRAAQPRVNFTLKVSR